MICVAVEAAILIAVTAELVRKIPEKVDARLDSIQASTFAEIKATRADLARQVELARKDTTAVVEKSATRVADTVDARGTVLDAQIESIGGTVKRLEPLIVHADHIFRNASETSDILLDCEYNPNCLANRAIGTLQAVERSAQAAERTARTVDAAMPVVIADAEQVTAASVQASKSTAGLMSNLEKQSKPLPLLLRFTPQAVQAVMLGIGVLK